jgi:uncharacterized membrane protein YgaE (UPF0421/DUF939 family)
MRLKFSDRNNLILIYIIKCLLVISISFAVAPLIHLDSLGWCVVSALIVLSPEGKDTYQLSMVRIKANLVGAAVGIALMPFHTSEFLLICIGVIFAIIICFTLKIEAGVRSACVSIVILMHGEPNRDYHTALDRVISVLLGCAISLLITYIFHSKMLTNRNEKINQHADE